ncbi:peptidoglycan DD-metalloendopeptidase family protein [Gemmobacter denitrificans]|uniref:Peptidoglycan DD-metalloendopeptidase family protein n=1 Tax=Gemmobacter denitrificans TaxID=3123040 RepID=A0ABU8BRI6_9RHOB
MVTTRISRIPQFILMGSALMLLTACNNGIGGGRPFDWDFRPRGISTADAALAASANRPTPDARGVISYPGYQVAVARRGDTVGALAARVGIDVGELARYNAVQPGDPLREGEVMALPRRVAEASTAPGAAPVATGAIVGAPIRAGSIDVTTVAGSAINRASPAPTAAPQGWQTGPQSAAQAPGVEPARHQVKRGETAFIIARAYNVNPKALAEWNGLDAQMTVREGQYLLIPTPAPQAVATAAPSATAVTVPGEGTPTPVPPSAAKPLPTVDEPPVVALQPPAERPTKPAAPGAKPAPAATPAAPAKPVADLGATRSAASSAKLAMPVSGQIIRGYAKGKNEGIDIGAGAGTSVAAAGDGTVAAITKNTDGVPILVIRHADNLLTVYGGIDAVSVAKGATVKRGQPIAKVRAGSPSFLHFEVRKGFDSVDPLKYLQ